MRRHPTSWKSGDTRNNWTSVIKQVSETPGRTSPSLLSISSAAKWPYTAHGNFHLSDVK
jgi:hypothetical protein